MVGLIPRLFLLPALLPACLSAGPACPFHCQCDGDTGTGSPLRGPFASGVSPLAPGCRSGCLTLVPASFASLSPFFFLESTFIDQINPKRQTAGPHEGGSPELDLAS